MEPGSRVVVTGAAAYTCCGLGCEAFWSRLRAGIGVGGEAPGEAARRFTPLDTTACDNRKIKSDHRLAARVLAAIDHDLGGFLAGLTAEDKEHMGVALGSAYGHLSSYFAYYQTGTEEGYQFVNPRDFPSTLPNFCTVEVNHAYSLWGSSTTVGTGLTAGLEVIGYAAAAIRRGEERLMLAGGLDELTDYNENVLRATGLHSPSSCILPFAANRDGTIPGEGVAVLLLQSAEAAQASGRDPLAEVCGTASASGVRWDAPGARAKAGRVIHQALAAAGLEASDVGAVFPSANGSVEGDEFEAALLRELFGKQLPSILVCPIKTVTGECFAASGPLQCLAAVYAVALAPDGPGGATGLLNNGTDLWLAEQISRQSTALVYSAGYDGTFAALVVRRPTR